MRELLEFLGRVYLFWLGLAGLALAYLLFYNLGVGLCRRGTVRILVKSSVTDVHMMRKARRPSDGGFGQARDGGPTTGRPDLG